MITVQEASASTSTTTTTTAGDRVSEFSIKQMDLNAETLGIPDSDYEATVTMPAIEFQRIIKDLTSFGEGLSVSVVKDAIKFNTTGDHGSASVTVRQSDAVDGVCVRTGGMPVH